jgi:hypothetical protein
LEVYVIIDALDECIDHKMRSFWSDLLDKLKVAISNMRVLCTSRHIDDDQGSLTTTTRIEIRAIQSDIEAYIKDKIKSKGRLIKFCEDDPSLQEEMVRTMASKADGMYISILLSQTEGRYLTWGEKGF